MNLTKLIVNDSKKNLQLKQKEIFALIASVFSVIFALSIVFELRNIVSGVVLVFLVVFIVLFLILNEKLKVENVRKLYKGNKKGIIPFGVTFLISVTLSSIGIYLWTNNSMDAKIEVTESTISQEILIQKSHQNKIDGINATKFSDTDQYIELKESIAWWKNRRAANVDERAEIRTTIETKENELAEARDIFNTKKVNQIGEINKMMNVEILKLKTVSNNDLSMINFQDKISYIFLIMILITELAIVVLNKEMAETEIEKNDIINTAQAKKFLLARKVLLSLYLTKGLDNKTTITHALYSQPVEKMNISKDKKWDSVKNLYNLFINLGILDSGELVKTKNKKRVLCNTFLLEETEAMERFDNYYNKLLTI